MTADLLKKVQVPYIWYSCISHLVSALNTLHSQVETNLNFTAFVVREGRFIKVVSYT